MGNLNSIIVIAFLCTISSVPFLRLWTFRSNEGGFTAVVENFVFYRTKYIVFKHASEKGNDNGLLPMHLSPGP